jgi:hyperosmotically inducible protein
MKLRILAALITVLAAAPAFADDGRLQMFRQVEKQVLQYPHFTIFDSVNAEIDEGVVRLTGKVTMPYKRTDIERRVQKLTGVVKVDNRIEVLPVSQFDDNLRLRIARAIYGNPAFHMYSFRVNPPIHVIVEHGRVTLEGVVLSNVDRVLARSIASNFLAFEITNALKTESEAKQELESL